MVFFHLLLEQKVKKVKSESPFIFSKSITSLAAKGIDYFKSLNLKYKLVIQSKFQKSKQKSKICTKLNILDYSKIYITINLTCVFNIH